MLQLVTQMPSMRKRIAVALLVGTLTGWFCGFVVARTHQESGDFRWAIHLAQRLLARQNPYDTYLEQYPLPAALFALPFVRVMPAIAAGIFYGLGSGLLALGLTRHGFSRLRIFLSYPFWAGALTAQWSPLIAAAAFFPWLMPAAMAKPQIGLPVFFTRFSRRGLIACVAVAALSLAVLPRWPWLWLGQAHYYEHFIPILVFPGPLVLLALWRYRDPDAWLLLLTACMPQRWFFDAFTLWLIPRSRWAIALTSGFSWTAGIWRWYHQPTSFTEVGRAAVLFFYLPMLLVLLSRKNALDPETVPDATPS